MLVKRGKPITPGRRFALFFDRSQLNQEEPQKKLTKILKKRGGRNSAGRVTTRHQGGGHKRFLRKIDFCRHDKIGIPAEVVSVEFDPNRGANIALLNYADGEKRYILAPVGLKIKDKLIAGPEAELKAGNALPLAKIPTGMLIHNVELRPGKGGQLGRGAGNGVIILSKEEDWAVVKLPSGEKRKILGSCFATIGQVSNPDARLLTYGKAGRRRNLGWRPAVRGVAMNPNAHPHGGGEGRSGIGMPSPKSPWGKKTLGKRTRKRRKYSDRFILERSK